MMVLAVDPGKVTGVVVWHDGVVIVAEERAPQDEFLLWADRAIAAWAPHDLRVVSESLRITPASLKAGADLLWITDANGALKHLCRKHGVPFVPQSASKAKTFAGDPKLKLVGWYKSTRGGHVNDAHKHLLTYLVDQGVMRPPLPGD